MVTLPCQHPFHEPCITPWLKSSGTCPVCRYVSWVHSLSSDLLNVRYSYALIPQPDNHPTPTQNPVPEPSQSSRPPNRSSSPPNQNSGSSGSGPARAPESGGLFHSLFGGLAHLAHGTPNHHHPTPLSGNRSGARSPPPPRSNTDTRRDSRHRRSNSDPAFSSSSSPESNRRRNPNHGNDNVPGSWAEDLD